MKKIILLSISLFLVILCFAQQKKIKDNQTVVIPCANFHITKPLSVIFATNPVDENNLPKGESEDRDEHRVAQKFPNKAKDNPKYGNDTNIIQREMGTIPGKAPITNWAGQNATGFRPFDPSGAVGPNHYVQMINSTTFKVYNKTTGAVTLTAALGNLWSPATGNSGDPIVLYDKAADRWLLAQFGTSSDKKIYIAISTTADPTGSYYTYTYVSPAFPDYLKFSVWTDGYYMTSNQAQKVFAFERTAMLAGNASARSLYTTFSPPNASGLFVPLPGDASDGTLPPVGTPCPIFSYSDNGWGSGYNDAINIYQMAVNWVPTTPTGTITLAANLATTAFDASYNASWNDVSQPGTAQKLDGIGGTMMYRSQWKSWSGYNSVVVNWGVQISATQRSIMWAELRQNQSTNVWSIYQQGIYTPDAATRWMASIAMNNNGDIAMAYLKSDATSIFPSLCYAGRLASDPLGTFPVAEVVAQSGTGSQTGINRVGDYSQTTLDPDGITFWHTGEYMGGATGGSAARTQIFSFQLPSNTAAVTITQTTGSNPSCAGSTNTFTATPTNGGTSPSYQWKINGINVGTNSPTYSSSSITNGQIVTCVMTSNLSGVAGSPATSNAITMTVNTAVVPSVAVAITAGSNPTCSGSSVTFTATPTNGGTPSYQWKVNGINVGTNTSTYSSTTLTNGQMVTCDMTSNASCASPTTASSTGITMTVNAAITPSVAIAITSGSNPTCAGTSVTFTATPINGGTPSYQWKVNGINVGTNSATYTSSTLTNGQIVTCVMTSSATCASPTTATSTGITMTVNAALVPSVAIAITSGANPTCAGTSVTFTATPTNGGTPSYQWKVNGINVGTNSATYTSTALSNGQIVTCVMTSSSSCASPTTATSTGITMTVNPVLLPSVTIAITSGTNPTCTSTPITFTATPTNGGTPTYQWKVNGINVGANTPNYSSTTLTSGDVITCVMTSTTCASPSSATSNGITMTVNPATTTSISATACNSYTWSCNGTTYTTSGTYTCTSLNANNCTNTTTLNLTINANTTSSQTVTATSSSYTWSVNNVAYTSSGTYTATSLNAAGCTLTSTLILTFPANNYNCYVKNFSQPTTSQMEFDIWIEWTGTNTAKLQSFQAGIDFNHVGMSNGGPTTMTGSFIAGTADPSLLAPQNAPTVSINSTSKQFRIAAAIATSAASAQTIPPPNGFRLGRFRIDNGGVPFTTNSTPNMVWFFGTASSTKTKTTVICYLNGASTGTTVTINANHTIVNPIVLNPPGPTQSVLSNGSGAATVCSPASANIKVTITGGTSPYTVVYTNGINNFTVNNYISGTDIPVAQTGTYSLVSVTATGGSTGLNLNSGTATVNINTCSATLNLKCHIQGYYIGANTMTNVLYNEAMEVNPSINADTITVELRNAAIPHILEGSFTGVLQTNGNITCTFPGSVITKSCYIVVRHRNVLETWSSNPFTLAAINNYDFTTAANKAYGNNEIDVMNENIWSMYNGDLDQDGAIDANDFLILDIDMQGFVSGYYASDINGDGTTDASDFLILDANIQGFITSSTP